MPLFIVTAMKISNLTWFFMEFLKFIGTAVILVTNVLCADVYEHLHASCISNSVNVHEGKICFE
jgi:hypothetical protein